VHDAARIGKRPKYTGSGIYVYKTGSGGGRGPRGAARSNTVGLLHVALLLCLLYSKLPVHIKLEHLLFGPGNMALKVFVVIGFSI